MVLIFQESLEALKTVDRELDHFRQLEGYAEALSAR